MRGTGTREALHLVINVRNDSHILALELLGKLCRREVGDAGSTDKAGGIGGKEIVLITVKRGATEGFSDEDNLVSLQISLFYHKTHTVGAGVLFIVEHIVFLGDFGCDGRYLVGEEGLVLEGVNPWFGADFFAVGDDFTHRSLVRHTVALALGGGEVEHHVFVSNPAGYGTVAFLKSNFGNEFLGVLPLLAYAGDNLALEEVACIFVGQVVALGLVGLFGAAGVPGNEVVFLSVELGLEESVFVKPFHLGQQHGGGILDTIFLGRATEDEIVSLAHIAGYEAIVASTGIHHGGDGFLAYFAETFVYHPDNK